MKKTILFLLLFVLNINALLAQITPTSTGTTTSDAGSNIIRIDIATPNASGLSNNSYTDFNISSSGIILNNSASTSSSQLTGGTITGNSNITAGNEATLILNQVTSNNSSLLAGDTEVVGIKAGVIIANPNGITCNGCGFINASRIDLITGTRQSDGSFNIDSAGNISVAGSGLDASEVDSLNITVGGDFFSDANITAFDNLSIQVGGDASLDDTASITANQLYFQTGGNLYNQADITIEGTASFDIGENFGNGLSYNDATFDGGIISVNDFHVSAGEGFYNQFGATISADNFNVTADYFVNSSATIGADNFNITANYFVNSNATIGADNFNITANYFVNSRATISANDLTISANSFFNTHIYGDGNISTDTLTISVAGNFDYVDDYLNNGNIDATSFNLTIGGNFSYDNANQNFVWNAGDSLVVLGNAFVTADSYTQSGTVEVTNNLNIFANGDASLDDTASITANQLYFQTGGNLYNQADITIEGTASFDIGENFGNGLSYNDATFDGGIISVNDFHVSAGESFYNLFGATISANNFNVTAGDDFTNHSNTTISADSFAVQSNGDFQNENNALIRAIRTGLFVNSFSNSGTIDSDDLIFVEANQDFNNIRANRCIILIIKIVCSDNEKMRIYILVCFNKN